MVHKTVHSIEALGEEIANSMLKEMIISAEKEITDLRRAVRIAHTALSYEFNPKSSSPTWDAHTEAGVKFMKLTIVKRIIQGGEKND